MENKPYAISNPDATRIANQVKPQELHLAEAQVPVDWNVGDVILDLYEVTGILGEGGMGKVYKVRHRGWNLDLAVKSPKPEILSQARGTENFEKECETWVNLGLSLHTVSCYYVRRLGGIPRVFAEYVEGGSLKDWIENKKLYEGGLEKTLERMLDIAIQFAWGLHYAHEHGLVHQDVKPANVMMTLDGLAKVTDFGLAKARVKAGEMGIGGAHQSILVSSGGMTPAYCSPEQANHEPLSRKTDIWSWGVSILEMFTGEVIWMSGQVVGEALERYLETGGEDKGITRMPEALADLLWRCFQKGPEDRPQNMLEIVAILQDVYEEIGGRAYPRKGPDPLKLRADALNNRAVSLLDLGHEQKAERCWEEALKADPVHLASTFNLGYYRWSKGRIDPQRGYYLNTLKGLESSYSRNPEYWYNIALIEAEIGLIDQAKNSARKAIELGFEEDSVKDILGFTSPPMKVFKGHADSVSSVAISPDGRNVISGGGRDQTLRLWDIETGKCLKVFEGHDRGIDSVLITPDGKYAISGSHDNTVRLWDIETGKCLKVFKGHTGWVSSVTISSHGRYIVSGSGDHTLRLWDIDAGECQKVFEGHTGYVNSVTISHDARYVLSGSSDKTLRLWEIDTGKCLKVFEGHSGNIDSVAITPDGKYAISGSRDNTVRLWDIETRKCLKVFKGHANSVSSVAICADGRYAIFGSTDDILVIEIETEKYLRIFEGPFVTFVTIVSISQNSKYAISGSFETFKLWKFELPAKLFQYIISIPLSSYSIQESEKRIGSFISKASSLIEMSEYGKAYKLLKEVRKIPGYSMNHQILDLINSCGLKGGERQGLNSAWSFRTFKGHSEAVTSVIITPESRCALSGSNDRTLRLWDIETGKCLRVFQGHDGEVRSVTITPDGRYAMSGSHDYTLRLWDIKTGECLRIFKGHGGPVYSVAVTPDGRYALSGSGDETLRLWEIKSGKSLRVFEGHTAHVTSVAITPDGRYALSGSSDVYKHKYDNTLRLWDIETGKCLRVFQGHDGWVGSVAVTPDGRYALSGSNDSTLRLWDIRTGECLRIFKGHGGDGGAGFINGKGFIVGVVNSVTITLDGKFAISGSHDYTLRLWDIKTGECLRIFEGHDYWVESVEINSDGRYAISGGWDNSIRLWELDWEWEFPEEEPSADKKERQPDTKPIQTKLKKEVPPKKTYIKQEIPPSHSNKSIRSRIKTLLKRIALGY